MKKLKIKLKTRYKKHNVETIGFINDLDEEYLSLDIDHDIMGLNEFVDGSIYYGKNKVYFEGKISELYSDEINGKKKDEIVIKFSKIGNMDGLYKFLSDKQDNIHDFMQEAKGL